MRSFPPASTSFPPREPTAMRRSFWVANRVSGAFVRSGPHPGSFVAVGGTIDVQNFGQLVGIDGRIKLPLASQATVKSIVTDIGTNVAYEVVFARPWLDLLEVYVQRKTAVPQ